MPRMIMRGVRRPSGAEACLGVEEVGIDRVEISIEGECVTVSILDLLNALKDVMTFWVVWFQTMQSHQQREE